MYSPNDDPVIFPKTPYITGTSQQENYPGLSESTKTDVLVIGGGVTGLSAALHSSINGLDVVLLEAKQVGWGASGRNSGHLPAATRQEPRKILSTFGAEYGGRIIHASRKAPELVCKLINDNKMNVQLVQTGGIQAAHNGPAMARLKQRVADLKTFGYKVELLDASDTAHIVGSDPKLYKGAVFDPVGGTLNPVAFVREMAKAAINAGTRLFEGTPVISIVKKNNKWVATTASGRIEAESCLICTNGYGHGLFEDLWRSFIGVRAYQFVTEPISVSAQTRVLPERQGFTDTRRMMSGVRIHPDGRLHFSGIGPFFGEEKKPNTKASVARIYEIFPYLEGIKVQYWWSGWMAVNRQTTWKLYKLGPGGYAAAGCNGRGLALGVYYGKELADYVAGKIKSTDLVLPLEKTKPDWLYHFRVPAVTLASFTYRLVDNIETRLSR